MPVALVTGASSGLGAEFSRQLAARGYDVLIVARDAARLTELAASLRAQFGVAPTVLSADLGTDAGCALVSQAVTDHDVDVLINNAGLGSYRPFGGSELEREERQLDLNVRAVLRLSHAAVRSMTARGSGRIVNVSSMAGFMPRGSNVGYAASKAWVTMFTESLAVQLHGTGVTVTALCPGFVRTEFHERAGVDMSHVPERMWLAAPDVVRDGLADAFAGKVVSVPNRRYKTVVAAARILPRPALRTVMARFGL